MPAADSPSRDTCLVLMLKAPSRSKRRLAADVGDEAATIAAAHLVACALEDLADWSGPTCVAPSGASDADWLQRHAGAAHPMVVQRGSNLGERINHVNRFLAAGGRPRQIFIGIDCPTLDQAYLHETARRLDDGDAVLGPAADGGVVLMAAARPWPDLAPLPWSTAELGRALFEWCSTHGFRTAELDARRDIDDLDDLRSLRQALATDRRPARRALHSWLSAFDHDRIDR